MDAVSNIGNTVTGAFNSRENLDSDSDWYISGILRQSNNATSALPTIPVNVTLYYMFDRDSILFSHKYINIIPAEKKWKKKWNGDTSENLIYHLGPYN